MQYYDKNLLDSKQLNSIATQINDLQKVVSDYTIKQEYSKLFVKYLIELSEYYDIRLERERKEHNQKIKDLPF